MVIALKLKLVMATSIELKLVSFTAITAEWRRENGNTR